MRASEAIMLLAAVLGTGDGEMNNLRWSEPRGHGGDIEILSEIGGDTVLSCPSGIVPGVPGASLNSVSWVRVAPRLEVISAGRALFSTSHRIRLTTSTPPSLHITAVLTDDEGVYECQLNTEPKRAWRYRLVVLKQAPPVPPYAVEHSMQRDLPPPPAITSTSPPRTTLLQILGLINMFFLILLM